MVKFRYKQVIYEKNLDKYFFFVAIGTIDCLGGVDIFYLFILAYQLRAVLGERVKKTAVCYEQVEIAWNCRSAA